MTLLTKIIGTCYYFSSKICYLFPVTKNKIKLQRLKF